MSIMERITYHPATGKGPELQALLEERVRYLQSKGMAAGLEAQPEGTDGPVFMMNISFEGHAARDEVLDVLRADPNQPAYRSKLTPLLAAPFRLELWEVLVPQPAEAVG